MAKRPSDDYERDLLDIIPERYNDADADSRQARAGHRLRSWVLVGGAVLVVGAIVAVGLHYVGGRKGGGMGVPVIKADDKPIKTRPDDRGGMQVPNQDKLVYERMDSAGDAEPRVERLMPQPESAKAPPKTLAPAPLSAEPPVAVPPANLPPANLPGANLPSAAQRPAPVPAKPGEPPAPKTAPAAKVSAQPMEPVAIPPAAAPLPPAYQPVQERAASGQPEQLAPAVVAQAPRMAPPPPPAAAPTAKAPASGDFVVQLGAVRAADLADKEWSRIQKANADLLGGLKPDIVRVELEGKGTFWRVRAAPLSEQAARQLCAELTSRSQGCIVARR